VGADRLHHWSGYLKQRQGFILEKKLP